jgi:MFS family permease
MIIAGLAVFTAASLGASLAGSAAVLITMRAAQGLGAAGFLPAALSTVRNMFTEGAERNKARPRCDRRGRLRRLAHALCRLGVRLPDERPGGRAR